MTKLQQVQQYIARAGTIRLHAIVLDLEVSPSTVRRTGNFNYLTLTRKTRTALSAELHLANERALIQSLQWAAPRVSLEVDFSSFYGWLVKLLPARAA